MGAREDLLLVAEALAGRARSHVEMRPAPDRAITEAADAARGAKAALEAAALVDADPAPIIAAAEHLSKRLEALGIESGIEIAAQVGGAEGAIDAVGEFVEQLIAIATRNTKLAVAYQALDELTERLEVDFSAAQTETAKRITARIQSARAVAREAMNTTNTGGSNAG